MQIQVDRKTYEVPDSSDVPMSGAELIGLAWPGKGRTLWEVLPGRCDEPVDTNRIYEMPKGSYRRFFTSPDHINNSRCALCESNAPTH